MTQVENDWCAAEVKRDAVALARIMADDFYGVGSRGGIEDKAAALSSLKDMASTTASCVNSNMKFKVYGDTAIVTGLVTRNGAFKATPYSNRQVLFTDVWVRRDGRWQCVVTQGTVVAAQQK